MYSKILSLATIKKASAEGIVPSKVKTALLAVSEAAKTGGYYDAQHLSNIPVLSLEALASTVCNDEVYGNGYVYSGSTWTTPYGRLDQVVNCVKERAEPLSEEEKEHNLAVLLSIPLGGEVYLRDSNPNDSAEETWTKTSEGFKITSWWSQQSLEQETGLMLFSGIRKAVAEKLGLDLSSTFHEVFDFCAEDIFYSY